MFYIIEDACGEAPPPPVLELAEREAKEEPRWRNVGSFIYLLIIILGGG